ncbi:MAG TPA: dTMP kinase [Thermomicrobiales bacterium]|nr:dTMP kinase [Thermomicrobiales bacterium]
MSAGTFVVFEGPEGAGKSTQMRRLADVLVRAGHDVVATREPGGTPVGDAIRRVLLESDGYAMLPETEAFLLSAARVQHVHEVIRPALDRGAVVLCDRYADSTLAYQGGGHGMAEGDLRCLERIATDRLVPDLRVLLDVPAAAGLARRHRDTTSVNRIDRASLAFHERVAAAYRLLAERDPEGWTVIDATQPTDAVFTMVCQAVQSSLGFSLEQAGGQCQV